MSYSYKVHLIKNNTSPAGHAFIELKSSSGSTFYELSTNPNFAGPATWMFGPNGIHPTNHAYADGQINKGDGRRADVGRRIRFGQRTRLLAVLLLIIYSVFIWGPHRPSVQAQARLVTIDRPASQEERKALELYFTPLKDRDSKVYFINFEGLNIFRIEEDWACINTKCITAVILPCAQAQCPHVKLLAEPQVFSNPLYIEMLGGVRGIVFGQPDKPGAMVIFGRNELIVTTIL